MDDELAIYMDGRQMFAFDYSTTGRPTPAIVEVPRATMERISGQTITVKYRDVYAALVGASDMWLIWVP